MVNNIKRLNRFTTLPFLIDMLKRKKMALLNPNLWEDYNDRVTMETYRREIGTKSIYALCLTDEYETIHHWNAFANGTSGCCIELDAQKLFTDLNLINGVSHGKTEYIKLDDLSSLQNNIEKLPYLKREPFSPESEYRIIATSNQEQNTIFEIPIDLSIITRIKLSSKLPRAISDSMKELLLGIDPTLSCRITHSTLFDNQKWRNHFAENQSALLK